MEKERKINWLGLFIKIIIIFVFVLIIIWLVSKIALRTKLSDTFKNNINNMETVATNYYKEIDLPLEKGKSLKVTLGEMIDKGLIVSSAEDKKNNCDIKKSFSKITRNKSDYTLTTTLKCGQEENTIKKKFLFKDCKNCVEEKKQKDEKSSSKNNKKDNNNLNEKNNNNSSSNNSNDTYEKTKYYEYVKETVSYTKWNKGNVTGNNIENRYEYYGIASSTYYTLGVIKASDFIEGNEITYTLKLNTVPNKEYYFSELKEVAYFDKNDEKNYISENKSEMNKEKYSIASSISKYSLNSNNFTYKLSPYYRRGTFYIDVKITIVNTSNVISYNSNKNNIYYVPLKLNVKFASDKITTSTPSGDYETIAYYRYVIKNRDVMWSSDNYVEGYTKTGNSELR